MNVSCPRCGSRFKLDAAQLGSGRRVRCSTCQHVWHQVPIEETKPASKPVRKTASKPASKAASKVEPSDSGAALGAGLEANLGFDDPIDETSFDPPSRSNSFGFSSIMEEEDNNARSMDADDDNESLPSLARFRSSAIDAEDESSAVDETRSRRKAIIVWAVLVLVWVGAGVGLWLGHDAIKEVWPPSSAFYDLFGDPIEPVGAGLMIPQDKSKVDIREIEGVALLVVSGEIVNDSDKPREVPDVKVRADDVNGQEVLSWVIEPDVRRLMPGQSVLFESTVPETSGKATQIKFFFVPPAGATPESGEAAAETGQDAGASDTAPQSPPADGQGSEPAATPGSTGN